MGMGMGLLDSLIAEGEVKNRDLSWVIYKGVVIEIGRARSDWILGMQLNFMLLQFLFRRIFCTHLFPFFIFVISYNYNEIHNMTF